jgi:hypothetical protein
MEAYGDLYGHRPEERAETRRGFLFAQHVERMLRDRSERARDIKEMLGDHAEDEDYYRSREDDDV